MEILSPTHAFRRSLFYPLIGGFVLGTLLEPLLPSIFFIVWSGVLAIGLLGWSFATSTVYEHSSRHLFSKIFLFALVLFAAAAGAFAFTLAYSNHGDPVLQQYVNQYEHFIGIVSDDPTRNDTATRIVARLISVAGRPLSEPTRITFSVSPYTPVVYGDEIALSGVLEKPTAFETDTGSVFSYDTYLAARHIFYTLVRPSVTIRAHGKGNPIVASLFILKKNFIAKLDAIIPFPESRLAAALTVAGKEALPTDIRTDFLRAGIIPIVVLSGFHVVIVAEVISWITGILSVYVLERIAPLLVARAVRYLFPLIGIALFCLMAGGSASVVRGGSMASLVIIAKLFHRRYSVHRALWISAFLMLLVNPLLTVYDPSFQFSFCAVAGLIYGGPIFSRAFHFVPERFGIRSVITSTTAAQFFVAPLIFYSMGQFSSVALITNLLIFFTIPIAMFAVFIVGLAMFFSPLLALPVAGVAWLLLAYDITVVHFISSLPFALWELPAMPLWVLIAVYGSIVFFVVRWYTRRATALPLPDFVQQRSN